MASLNLYLLRHGETEFSQSGGFCGNTDAELTSSGKEMAKQFADAYKDFDWHAIYSSPLQRAVATATPIASARGLEIQKRDGLKEINYGNWEGKNQSFVLQNYASDYKNWLREPGWNSPTGGENAFEISERAMSVFFEIKAKYDTGNILVVSHKATIRILICTLMGIELGRYRDRINTLTASLSLIKMNEHGPLLDLLNDRSHLSSELRNRAGN